MNLENQNPELWWAAPLVVWKVQVSLSAGSGKQAFFFIVSFKQRANRNVFWVFFSDC